MGNSGLSPAGGVGWERAASAPQRYYPGVEPTVLPEPPPSATRFGHAPRYAAVVDSTGDERFAPAASGLATALPAAAAPAATATWSPAGPSSAERSLARRCQEGTGSSSCLGAGAGMCLQADRAVTTETWSYVGSNRGGYELLSSFDYVGEGCGSFAPQPRVATGIFDDQASYDSVGRCGSCGMCGATSAPRTCLAAAVLIPILLGLVLVLLHTWHERRPDAVYELRNELRGKLMGGVQRSGEALETAEQNVVSAVGPAAQRAAVAIRSAIPSPQAPTPAPAAATTTPAASEEERRHPDSEHEDVADRNGHTQQDSAQAKRYDCKAGLGSWRRAWPRRKKDWCCRHEGAGCPANRSPVAYDCQKGAMEWEAWTSEKKDWCCGYLREGCKYLTEHAKHAAWLHSSSSTSTTTATSTATSTATRTETRTSTATQTSTRTGTTTRTKTGAATTTSTRTAAPPSPSPEEEEEEEEKKEEKKEEEKEKKEEEDVKGTALFDCGYGFEHWETEWSNHKQEWCCSQKGRGCSTTTTTTTRSQTATRTHTATRTSTSTSTSTSSTSSSTTASTSAVPAEAEAHLAAAVAAQAHMAASKDQADQTVACDTICSLKGQSYSCNSRISWAAMHKFEDRSAVQACKAAHDLVSEECAICQACPLQEAYDTCLSNAVFASSPRPSLEQEPVEF